MSTVKMTEPTEARAAAPAPVEIISGSTASAMAAVVMGIGRSPTRAAAVFAISAQRVRERLLARAKNLQRGR